MIKTVLSEFRQALIAAIRKQIAVNRKDGITWMSVENLKMVVRPPSQDLKGAPRGTNYQYFYAQEFAEACASLGVRERA